MNRLSDSWLQIGWKWQGLGLALRDSRPCGWMPVPLRYAVAAALSAVGAKPLRTRRARGYRERCFPEVPAINSLAYRRALAALKRRCWYPTRPESSGGIVNPSWLAGAGRPKTEGESGVEGERG